MCTGREAEGPAELAGKFGIGGTMEATLLAEGRAL